MSTHNPAMITWICEGCNTQWPCDTRRLQLMATYVGSMPALVQFMTANMLVAMNDHPAVPCGVVYRRFLGWIRNVAPRFEQPTEANHAHP